MTEKPSITAIYEAIGGSVPYSQSRYVKVKCLWHDDKTPSATICEEYAQFKCFTCDLSLDSFGVLMRHHKITFKEAADLAREHESEWGATSIPGQGGGDLRRTGGHSDSLLPRKPGLQRSGGTWRPSWRSW